MKFEVELTENVIKFIVSLPEKMQAKIFEQLIYLKNSVIIYRSLIQKKLRQLQNYLN